MADSSSSRSGKTLEMRVAELEDKLAQTQITEDDIKAYYKVAAAMAAKAGSPSIGSGASVQTCIAAAQPCIANQATGTVASLPPCIIHPISHCIIQIAHCIIHPIITQDCTCGPCIQASGPATAPVQKEFEDLGSEDPGS